MSAVLKVVPTAHVSTNKQSKRKPTNYGGLLLRGGIWHMRFTIKGQTVAESTHTSKRQEAERILAKRKSELVQEVVLAGKKPIKLHDGIDAFVASRSHMPSHQNCQIHIGYFKAAPNHYLDRITDAELQAGLHRRKRRHEAQGCRARLLEGGARPTPASSFLRVAAGYFE